MEIIEEESSNFYLLTDNRRGEVTFKNENFENNCFVNICFHFFFHINELKKFLLEYNIISDTPKLLVSLIKIISSYDNIIKKMGKKTIDPIEFRNDLANYFKDKNEDKYQLYKMEEPIEFLIFMLTFIHNINNNNNNSMVFSKNENINNKKIECKCIIHSLFYLNIMEIKGCEKCGKMLKEKYDENLFVFNEINIEGIINYINTKNFSIFSMKNKLFHHFKQFSKEDSSLCEKCKIKFKRKLYLLDHGKYLILNLILNLC
jgi:hypothetical protein